MTEPFPMLPLGLAVVRQYAAERAQLERSGRKKSDFDLMIACTAIEHEATLVTHDPALKDSAIDGLVVEDWLDSGIGRPNDVAEGAELVNLPAATVMRASRNRQGCANYWLT